MHFIRNMIELILPGFLNYTMDNKKNLFFNI